MQRVEITGTSQPYQAPPTTAATKTDAPILLTPQSMQVVPRAVLNDQRALTLTDAVRNMAGVGTDSGFNGSAQPLLILRGGQTTSMTAAGNMSGIVDLEVQPRGLSRSAVSVVSGYVPAPAPDMPMNSRHRVSVM